MRSFTVEDAAPVLLAPANSQRAFVTIQPIGGDIFIVYDGDQRDLTAALLRSDGQKVEDGTTFALVNRPGQNFVEAVWAVADEAGTADVRVQGSHTPPE